MKIRSIAAIAAGILLAASVQSCTKDNKYKPAFSAIVTVQPEAECVVLQLNDSVTLNATNLKPEAFTKVNRAMVSFSFVEEEPDFTKLNHDVTLYAIDTILTKLPSPDLGVDNDAKYGTDKLEIIDDWVTIGEDGYLNLRVRTMSAYHTAKHVISLVHVDDAELPNTYEIRHDAHGDNFGQYIDGLVAFDLNSLCPADRSPVTLHLKWEGFERSRTADCKLTFRKQILTKSTDVPKTGRIVDENGDPIIGASIVCLDCRRNHTTSDSDGYFDYTKHGGHTVQITILGYETSTIKLPDYSGKVITLTESPR